MAAPLRPGVRMLSRIEYAKTAAGTRPASSGDVSLKRKLYKLVNSSFRTYQARANAVMP